tara:strand:- start:2079 stop:3092 length:1014 start_codon:yes stop_codon:yes gene_type:complete
MNIKNNKYLSNELNLRQKGRFPYLINEIEFINNLNEGSGSLESELIINEVQEDYPNVFILGLPRSGTTLLSQLLFNTTDLYCTNNLIAKFWKTPLVGTMLSKIVLGNTKSGNFDSVFSKTRDVYSPHEFGWFWQYLSQASDIRNYNIEKSKLEINWVKVRSIILNMNNIIQGGMIFKPLEYAAYHIDEYLKNFNNILFVFIERNPADIAFSLADARKKYYNDLNKWWGSYPIGYPILDDHSYWEQIPSQVYFLKKLYETVLNKIPTERLIKTTYASICDSPQELLDLLQVKVKKLTNCNVEQITPPPKLKGSFGKRNFEEEIVRKLNKGLMKYELIK